MEDRKKCEKCGARPMKEGFLILDYCVECSKDLCKECMDLGCCGNVPALSGNAEDANYVPKIKAPRA